MPLPLQLQPVLRNTPEMLLPRHKHWLVTWRWYLSNSTITRSKATISISGLYDEASDASAELGGVSLLDAGDDNPGSIANYITTSQNQLSTVSFAHECSQPISIYFKRAQIVKKNLTKIPHRQKSPSRLSSSHFSPLSRRRLDPMNLACNPFRSGSWLKLTASAFKWLMRGFQRYVSVRP